MHSMIGGRCITPEYKRTCRTKLRSAIFIITFGASVLVLVSVAGVWFPSAMIATNSITNAREDQLQGTSANVANEISAYFQRTTQLARAFRLNYAISHRVSPGSGPTHFLDTFGSGAWAMLKQNPFVSSLLIAQARDPSLVNPDDPGCDVDAMLLSASYKAYINPNTSGTGLSSSPAHPSDAAVGGSSRVNHIQGELRLEDPLAIRAMMFENSCASWLGGSEFLWPMQNLPGSWDARDSGVGSLMWTQGVVIVGSYPAEALYKKILFDVPGPSWAPNSAFGALSMRVGSASISGRGDSTLNVQQILMRAASHTGMETILFLVTDDGSLLASSIAGQEVEARLPPDHEQYPGKITGLVRASDPGLVRDPIQPVAEVLIERHCTAGPDGLHCAWEGLGESQHYITTYTAALRRITDPLAPGLNLLLVTMVHQDEVLEPAHKLNTQLSIIGPLIFVAACFMAACFAQAISVPLTNIRDSISLLGRMKVEEAREVCARGSAWSRNCGVLEVLDLRGSFQAAAEHLGAWRDAEKARRLKLEEEAQARIAKTVARAEESAGRLEHPMVLVEASVFLGMQALVSYESLRDTGRLTFLDTEEDLAEFRLVNLIVFLSHQWLGWGTPDPGNVHLRAMKRAVEHVSASMSPPGGAQGRIYVWVDYCSIAQKHRGMQMQAVSSLPTYASSAHAFVVVAPPAVHEESHQDCGLESYSLRGWCRAEMLAKVCSSGLSNFFVLDSSQCTLQPIDDPWLDRLPLHVFDGEFSCCQLKHKGTKRCDKESLMVAVLGLYSQIISTKPAQHMEPVLRHIYGAKDEFFPRRFQFAKQDGTMEDRELFGTLIEAMEEHIQKTKSPSGVMNL